MKTLDRYIAGLFLKNIIIAILAMSALFLFQTMFSDLYDHEYSTHHIFVYHMMNLPLIAVQMCPPGVLLATVLTLSGLARTHELVACYAIGYGLKRIFGVILACILLIAGLIFFSEDRILPPVFRIRTNYYWREMKNRPDFFLDIKMDKIWYRSRNVIYNLQRFDPQTKTIFGMSVYTFDDEFNLTQVINAETGNFNGQSWQLNKGSIALFEDSNPFPLIQRFNKKEIQISESPKDFQEIEKEVDGLTLKELNRYIRRMKSAGADTKKYEVKFHSRLSLGFISIVMGFLAVPFSISSRREGGIAKDLGLCLVITFFYWLFYSIGLSLGSNGVLLPWLAAWFPSTVFLALAAILIIRKRS